MSAEDQCGFESKDSPLTPADQNLWEVIATDGTAVTANAVADTLTLAGAGIIVTSQSGDTITITGTEVDGSTTNEINTITAGDANSTAGLAITFVDGGIITTTEAGDSITITATEAQDLDAILTIGATADTESITLTAGVLTAATLTDGTLVITGGVITGATLTAADNAIEADTVTNATFTTALTVDTGTVTLTGHADNDSVLTIGKGAVGVSGSNTGDDVGFITDDASDTMVGELTLDPGVLFIKEQAEASADVAAFGQLWVDTATPNTLMFTSDTGIDYALVVDATVCTDIEGTSLVITAGVLNAIGVDEAYTSGWNGDTGIPEKDDIYDYLHTIDTDDDGAVNNVDIDVIDPTHLANADWGDFTISSGNATLDTDTVSDNEIDYTNVLLGDFTINATAYDFGGVTSVELPNNAVPTTDATGEIALDITITDHQPLFQYYDGGENMTIIALDTAQLPANDNEILKYNAATDKFEFETDQTGGTGFWTDVGAYLEPTSGEYLVISGTHQATSTEGLEVNDGGGADADDDFRVETDTEDNFLWVDAGSNLMRIGDMDTNYIQITSGGVLTLEGIASLPASGETLAETLAIGADANDLAITSLAKLEGVDPQVYIDLGTDGKVILEADTSVDITISVEITGLVTLTSGQIKFPASPSASADANTLDEYEEGSWTPVVGGNATYLTQDARYIKNGKTVILWGELKINVLGTGSATTISGLPFTSITTAPVSTGSVSFFGGLATNVIFISNYVIGNSTNLTFVSAVASTTTVTNGPSVLGNSAQIIFNAVYEAAD